MRILIDTNILIHLEDNKVVDDVFYTFYELAIRNNCQVLYHPNCIVDLSKDKDVERKKIIKSKIKKYTPLENPAPLDEDFTRLLGQKKDNDRIDNSQLIQLYKGYIELFVTNDLGIHKKSKVLNLNKFVLSSAQALAFLDEKFTLKVPSHPVIEHVSVRNLEEDFESPFFESLRRDYGGEKFMNWISKCAKKDRKCYRLKIENNLSALLIYNRETENEHNLKEITSDAIKMCTLKVGDDALGLKLGELFINLMLHLAVHQNVNYVYVTTYDKQIALIQLLKKFGFKRTEIIINNVGNKENVFVKSLIRKDLDKEDQISIHPYFRVDSEKYVVPIRPEFYRSLFKDGNLRTPTLFDKEMNSLQEIQGNTIIKAYISKTQRIDLQPGNLLFFYSSEKYKCIEPVGVLLEHKRVEKFDELWDLVKSKTVYEQETLKKWLADSKYLTVSIFRLAQYLNPIISFKEIKQLESFSNKFQTITKLTEIDFEKCIKQRLDENFIID